MPESLSKFRTIKILETDYFKIKKWSALQDKKLYEVVNDRCKRRKNCSCLIGKK